MLARLLVRAGATVQPLLTRSARRFVGPDTFAGITGRAAPRSMFGGAGEPHVDLARWSELIVIAPATADLLACLAQGRADDLVSATALCAQGPIVAAPAMHPRMWTHPATRANVAAWVARSGNTLVGPVFGEVASGERGLGRMAEPEAIFEAVVSTLAAAQPGWEHSSAAQTAAAQTAAVHTGAMHTGGSELGEHRAGKLAGRRVVVTAGPTIEDIDPVRALTNRSSGKMGFALAASAAACGAHVRLIAGPVPLATPHGVERIDVRSALDMQRALQQTLGDTLEGADVLVMCAAVADYRPEQALDRKLKRGAPELTLKLVQNPDLLAEIGARRANRERPLLVGFAVESVQGDALVEAARKKLASKRVDAVVANYSEDALGTDDTRAVWVTADAAIGLGPGSKRDVSDAIIEYVAQALAGAGGGR